MEERDAVIVGAPCGGSTLAPSRRGWDVMMVDPATFPSPTVSTHFLWPSILARLDDLGVLDALHAEHEVPLLGWRVVGMGHETAGLFTPIDGFGRGAAPRRAALDHAFVETIALARHRGKVRRARGRSDEVG